MVLRFLSVVRTNRGGRSQLQARREAERFSRGVDADDPLSGSFALEHRGRAAAGKGESFQGQRREPETEPERMHGGSDAGS